MLSKDILQIMSNGPRGAYRIMRDCRIVQSSCAFDADFYLQQCPDVAKLGLDPLLHYLRFGVSKGLDPNPLFDSAWYLEQYRDVVEAGKNPLIHFIEQGWREGRAPNPLFDTAWYLEKYPDVAKAGINPLVHYSEQGWKEGNNPNPYFDAKWYLAAYPDIAQTGREPLAHFIEAGCKEKRNPSVRFDTAWYLSQYADVARSGMNPLAHYIWFGILEGRHPNRKSAIKHLPASAFEAPGAPLLDNKELRSPAGIDCSILRRVDRWHSEQERFFTTDILEVYRREPAKFDSIEASIVMPTYNRAFCVAGAIKSVLDQSHQNWRLKIVDDGSNDNTWEVLQDFGNDKRIYYVRQPSCGVASARNRGLSLATGRYVFYLDSDNAWRDDFLRTMIVYMEAAELDAAYCGLRVLDDDGDTLCFRGDLFSWSQCCARNYIDMNTFGHRREITENPPVRFDESLKRLVDWDFILRTTVHKKVSFAPFLGVDYYHGDRGSRITQTEYTKGNLPAYESKIRAKHGFLVGKHKNYDAMGWFHIRETLESPVSNQSQTIVRFYPDYRVNNPYQKLLYKSFHNIDVKPGSIFDCAALIRRSQSDKVAPRRQVIFHLHWTHPIFAPGRDEEEAKALVDAFLDAAKEFVGLGGRIFWTIHNVVSHEPKYREQELRLANALCVLAEQIHVHDEDTMRYTDEYYSLPREKVLVAQHGSYLGVLPDEISQEEARARLEIPSDAVVFIMFGQLRAYKGLDELIEAYEQVAGTNPDCWLVLAGKPLQIDLDKLQRQIAHLPNVILRLSYVPDEDVQIYLRAADVAVLPYRSVLTSGSVLLAFSFDLPVIAPKKGLLTKIVEDGTNGFFFDAGTDIDLANSMAKYLTLDTIARRELTRAAHATAKVYRWEDASRKLLRAVVRRPGAPTQFAGKAAQSWVGSGRGSNPQGLNARATRR